MTAPPAGPGIARDAAGDPAGAGPGGEAAFARLVARHRAELYRHCLRMLRSPERAEDALQEALLRAWRGRAGFGGRASFRNWLYRIATNACLDEIGRGPGRGQRPRPPVVPLDDVQLAAAEPGPDVVAEARETLERAFLVAIELLPPRQRAALILCDVLGYPAAEAAALLGTSVTAVYSTRQRARATLAGEPRAGARPAELRPGSARRALLDGYVEAVRRADVAAVLALARTEAGADAA